MLTLALTKGRILNDTLPLLKHMGIEPEDDIKKSRKLLFKTSDPKLQLIVLRGSDVTTYVSHGTADIGVVGKDMLMEYSNDISTGLGASIYEMLDLHIAKCRLMTAIKKNAAPVNNRKIKVATKFVNIAKAYYASQGIQIDVIKLYGAMELAPIMGLADEIVDIVDTGNTLKANGLITCETIASISSRLIVNKASLKRNHEAINALVDAFAAVISNHD